MRLQSLLLLASLALTTPTFAEPMRVPAAPHVTAVTVYPDRALTTRSATVPLNPGSQVVVFDRLPVLIQDDSVRVSARGSAAATIVGVEVKRAFAPQVPEQRAQELEQEIRTLEHQVSRLDAKKTALASQRGFLDSIRVAWGERISKELAVGKPTAGELNEALSFVGSGVAKVEEQSRDLDEEKRQLKERIDALRRQRDEAMGSRRRETKIVEVALEVSRGGDLTVELTGVVPQASWEPAYDVRLAADGASAEMTFRALVRQQTGEDWQNTSLSLSTARPALGGAPPELPPWHISFYRPPPPPRPMAAPAPEAMSYGKAARAFEAPEQAVGSAPADYLTAELSEEQQAVSFHIPRPVSVPSDGTQHGNVVALEKLPVSLEYLAVPKMSQHVYLKSEIVNRASYPLLPGKVNTFSGDHFIGSSYLKKVAAGENFDLFFGADDQITVKREELKSHKEAGIFGKNRTTFRYRIEVQNFHKEPHTVTVRDQLPIPQDEEIKVSLDAPSVKPEEVKQDGTVTWKLPVGPGEKKEITFGIVVEYPKDREVVGL